MRVELALSVSASVSYEIAHAYISISLLYKDCLRIIRYTYYVQYGVLPVIGELMTVY